jgi:tRNA pseudouridine38-40 synthase
MARNLKLTLSYDGSDFHGWQVQPGLPTVQGTLMEALARLTGESALPQGSGRTDTGVHALAQVASWTTSARIPTENLGKALNDVLPPSIRVLRVEEAPPDFHARTSARSKTYQYRIYRGTLCPPFLARYVFHHPFPLNEQAIIAAAEIVAGEHDFTSFAAVDPERNARVAALAEGVEGQGATDDDAASPSKVRTIFESRWERTGEELIYTVRGSGFLHHMVRNLIGTFLLLGKGTLDDRDLKRILHLKDRSAAGPTAPANGLYLVSVEY